MSSNTYTSLVTFHIHKPYCTFVLVMTKQMYT